MILLWHAGRLPWVALAIPARDVLLIAATPFSLGRGYRFEVNIVGKVATWLLYASLALVMVVHDGLAALALLGRVRARDRVARALRPPRGRNALELTLDGGRRLARRRESCSWILKLRLTVRVVVRSNPSTIDDERRNAWTSSRISAHSPTRS